MPSKTIVSGEYYHVYNRGVDKRTIFRFKHQYLRFIITLRRIMDTGSATKRLMPNQRQALKPLKRKVKIICYCLMPNHYHFLLQQLEDNGISELMHKLETSLSKYINMNSKRKGHILESRFKSKHIHNEELLLHISRYIHLNPLIGKISNSLETYQWSSYLDYIGLRNGTLCHKEEVLFHFNNNTQKYQQFIMDQAEYSFLLKESESEDEDNLFL